MTVETPPESPHRVKIAAPIRMGRSTGYVVECACGWSSAIHWTIHQANAAYAKHKDGNGAR